MVLLIEETRGQLTNKISEAIKEEVDNYTSNLICGHDSSLARLSHLNLYHKVATECSEAKLQKLGSFLLSKLDGGNVNSSITNNNKNLM